MKGRASLHRRKLAGLLSLRSLRVSGGVQAQSLYKGVQLDQENVQGKRTAADLGDAEIKTRQFREEILRAANRLTTAGQQFAVLRIKETQ